MGLDTVELIMAVEVRFGIRIENRDAERASTVGQLHQLVMDKLLARGETIDEEATYSQLRDVVCMQLGVRPEKVVPSASIVDDLGAD